MNEVDARPPSALAKFGGEKPPAPDWFARALAAPHEDGVVEVKGAKIVWRAWGERGAPGLILVHGGLAHLSWWDFIAPLLAEGRRVVACSLSGMGDSDWREAYELPLHAAEAIEAGKAGGAFDGPGKPVLLGHSYGAFVTLTAAGEFGDELAGAIMCDAPIRPIKDREIDPRTRRGGRIYPTKNEALARFRLAPASECENDYIVDHVAREALRETDEGWTWKHDPEVWLKSKLPRRDPVKAVSELKCRLALVRGGVSAIVKDEVWSMMRGVLPADMPMVSVPEAAHHLMLDQPLAFVAAIDGVLSVWPGKAGAG